MKKLVGFWVFFLSVCFSGMAQVDTSYVYNTTMPYGTLDIRLAKNVNDYFYLQENITFSYRESSPGVKTNTYLDMTSFDSSPYTQGNMREHVSATKDMFIMNYRLLYPKSYTTSYSAGFPLLVMMHGLGERANCWGSSCFWADSKWNPNTNNPAAPTDPNSQLLSNDNNLIHAGSPELTARNNAGNKLPNDPALSSSSFPGFVLHAQNLNGWDVSSVQNELRLIRLLIKKYNIDPNRVYIHGLSDGGAGVYEAIKRAPWIFAAALPMSAISDASINSKGLAPKIASIPLWTFQGGQDTGPTPGKTELYVKQFREAGVSIRYTLYPNLGHGTWNTAYAEPDFWTWILSKNKANITVFYNNPTICGTTGQGVKLGFAWGFKAYQWEKDGVIIDGANAAEYIAMDPGVYRARFSRKSSTPSESDWNAWSTPVTVTLSNPAQSQIIVTGTTAMRGPDNSSTYNTVKLRSSAKDDHYYWYKNGILINIPSNTVDDTVRNYNVTSSSNTGNGVFTLNTKGFDNCPSPTSAPLNLYFGNSAPLLTDDNIPTAFASTGTTETTADLTWSDNSSVEDAYEIWRRKPGGTFVWAGRTAANATTFHDSGLEPGVAYDYKVRAINSTGRSKYAPNDNKNINLTVTTLADTTPPSNPTVLKVLSNTDHTITLSWTAATDNTGIRQYMVYFGSDSVLTTTNASTYVLSGLPVNMGYYITVKAIDLGGLSSGKSNQVVGWTYVTGLTYGHTTGAWTDLDQITNWNTPEFTGHVSNFTLNPRTQEDFFFFNFDGYVYITNGGNYQFRTTSDDGSRLTLNNVVIVDNDGLHGNVTVTSANQALASGTAYPINVKFFEYTGGQYLQVQYKGPDTGNNWVNIPDAVLKSGNQPAVPPASVIVAKTATDDLKVEGAIVSTEKVFNIYPNPTKADNINVQISGGLVEGMANLKMTDLMGRTVYSNIFSHQQLNTGVQIRPSENLINGMYIIHVHQGSNVIKQKVMIEN